MVKLTCSKTYITVLPLIEKLIWKHHLLYISMVFIQSNFSVDTKVLAVKLHIRLKCLALRCPYVLSTVRPLETVLRNTNFLAATRNIQLKI